MRCLTLASTIVLAVSNCVCAHGISGNCFVHGSRVTVQAYYDTDEPAPRADVQILDAEKKEVARGKTDDQGAWTFPHPGKGRFLAVIDAGAGHRAEVAIELGEAEIDISTVASTGPDRTTFTGYKLARIAAGLIAIGILAVITQQFLRKRRTVTPIE